MSREQEFSVIHGRGFPERYLGVVDVAIVVEPVKTYQGNRKNRKCC
jgi:hypothetical protein